jgi:hypothetical protein
MLSSESYSSGVRLRGALTAATSGVAGTMLFDNPRGGFAMMIGELLLLLLSTVEAPRLCCVVAVVAVVADATAAAATALVLLPPPGADLAARLAALFFFFALLLLLLAVLLLPLLLALALHSSAMRCCCCCITLVQLVPAARLGADTMQLWGTRPNAGHTLRCMLPLQDAAALRCADKPNNMMLR